MKRAAVYLLLIVTFLTPAASAQLDFKLSPVLDMHHWVRSLLEDKGQLPAHAGLEAAVAAVRALESDLGGSFFWGFVEGAWVDVSTAAELKEASEDLPLSFKMRDGRTAAIRERALAVATAYAALEPVFLAEVWPAHRKAAEEARARLSGSLAGKQEAVFADLAKGLGAPPFTGSVPVYLTAEGPWPGAVTHRKKGGGAVIFVAADAAQGTQFVEIVLHEATHAIDLAAGESSVLAELRKKLGQVPNASPKEVHDFVHTVMFAQAGETVRRVLAPEHKDYGDVNGYYPKVPRATAAVVPAWRAYLAGEITRDEAVRRIVAGFEGRDAVTRPAGGRRSPGGR
jgi:hypothetical protein